MVTLSLIASPTMLMLLPGVIVRISPYVSATSNVPLALTVPKE